MKTGQVFSVHSLFRYPKLLLSEHPTCPHMLQSFRQLLTLAGTWWCTLPIPSLFFSVNSFIEGITYLIMLALCKDFNSVTLLWAGSRLYLLVSRDICVSYYNLSPSKLCFLLLLTILVSAYDLFICFLVVWLVWFGMIFGTYFWHLLRSQKLI